MMPQLDTPRHEGPIIPDVLVPDVIRRKVVSGALPRERPDRVYAGHGTGSTCDACERPIERTDVEYELIYPVPARAYRLHLHCVHHWETVRCIS